jgi:hypothetical protein
MSAFPCEETMDEGPWEKGLRSFSRLFRIALCGPRGNQAVSR